LSSQQKIKNFFKGKNSRSGSIDPSSYGYTKSSSTLNLGVNIGFYASKA